jgi:hypothetical protein
MAAQFTKQHGILIWDSALLDGAGMQSCKRFLPPEALGRASLCMLHAARIKMNPVAAHAWFMGTISSYIGNYKDVFSLFYFEHGRNVRVILLGPSIIT